MTDFDLSLVPREDDQLRPRGVVPVLACGRVQGVGVLLRYTTASLSCSDDAVPTVPHAAAVCRTRVSLLLG